MRLRTTTTIAVAVATALIPVGCGIPDTPVIDAGPPVVTLVSPRTTYFLDASSTLVPVVFPPQSEDEGRTAVDLLFGPRPDIVAERGLTSQVPMSTDNPIVVLDDATSELVVTLPVGETMPSGLGLRQLACTALGTSDINPGYRAAAISVRDDSGASTTATC